MRLQQHHLIGLAIISFFFSSCGRKSKTIYQFDHSPKKKVTKLSLPAVRGTHVVLRTDGNLVTWQPANPALISVLDSHITFVGYHVYRFLVGGGVPHKSVTKNPIQETMYKDLYAKPACYLVRCVFQYAQDKDKMIIGPAGQSVCSNVDINPNC